MNEYISTNEAAALLNRTPRRVRQMVEEGKLSGQLKGRDLWISRASVEALVTLRNTRRGALTMAKGRGDAD